MLGGVLTAVLVAVTVASLLAAGHFNQLRRNEAQAARKERDARHEAELSRQVAEETADEAGHRSDGERWQRYRANIAAAGSALQLQSSGAARRALEATPAEYRDWEWLHFSSRLDDARLVLPGGGGIAQVGNVAFRPDSKQVAAGHNDAVRVWDAATGREVAVLPGQGADLRELSFSPDGRCLLVFSWDGTLRSWAPATNDRQVLLRIPYEHIIGNALSPDGRLLVGMKDHAGQLWDVSLGRSAPTCPAV